MGAPTATTAVAGTYELHLRVLSEAVPMQQFEHMIKKRDFAAAEAFARAQRIDLQVRPCGRSRLITPTNEGSQ